MSDTHEIDSLHSEIINLQDQRDLEMKVIKRLEGERDEARELLASEKITRDHVIKRGIEMQKERDEAQKQNAKLRDIAEKAIVPLECDGVPWGAKLRAELDQIKEKVK
jgi:hypothetical protein